MNGILIIREGRILLEEATEHEKRLSLKICVGANIQKFHNLTWSAICNRWETPQEIKLEFKAQQNLEMELYYPSRSIPRVVGEASIELGLMTSHLQEELKIALTYDGMIKGWFYFQVDRERQNSEFQAKPPAPKFLSLTKISFFFIQDYQEELKLQIYQNTESIYNKSFFLNKGSKIVFPNVINFIKYSDVIRICIMNQEQEFKTIEFLVDNIKRGKTTNYETWIKNKYNCKVGDLKLEYFLENLFLENDRNVTRKQPVYPHILSRASNLLTKSIRVQRSETLEKTQEKIKELPEGQSENCIEKDMNTCESTPSSKRRQSRLFKNIIRTQNPVAINDKAMPCMKKSKTSNAMPKLTNKEKIPFYFENPLQ